jgi:hypothetical protein
MLEYKGGATSSKSRSTVSIGVATVNQLILDFENNSNNIINAIKEASEKNVKILGFPELAICGYSCQDHFFERELFVLSYYMLKHIVINTHTFSKNMIVALGCPIMHRDVRYNCTVFFANGKIILISLLKSLQFNIIHNNIIEKKQLIVNIKKFTKHRNIIIKFKLCPNHLQIKYKNNIIKTIISYYHIVVIGKYCFIF